MIRGSVNEAVERLVISAAAPRRGLTWTRAGEAEVIPFADAMGAARDRIRPHRAGG